MNNQRQKNNLKQKRKKNLTKNNSGDHQKMKFKNHRIIETNIK